MSLIGSSFASVSLNDHGKTAHSTRTASPYVHLVSIHTVVDPEKERGVRKKTISSHALQCRIICMRLLECWVALRYGTSMLCLPARLHCVSLRLFASRRRQTWVSLSARTKYVAELRSTELTSFAFLRTKKIKKMIESACQLSPRNGRGPGEKPRMRRREGGKIKGLGPSPMLSWNRGLGGRLLKFNV